MGSGELGLAFLWSFHLFDVVFVFGMRNNTTTFLRINSLFVARNSYDDFRSGGAGNISGGGNSGLLVIELVFLFLCI